METAQDSTNLTHTNALQTDDKRDVKDWFKEGIDAYRQRLQLYNFKNKGRASA